MVAALVRFNMVPAGVVTLIISGSLGSIEHSIR